LAEVQAVREGAAAAASFLAGLPQTLATRRAEVDAAAAAELEATARFGEAKAEHEQAEREDERLATARALERARDRLREAELRLASARGAVELLEREAHRRRDDAASLEARAAELAARPRLAGETAHPPAGLDALLDWASRARGELLLARAGLATEREAVVREASEVVASVLGEPLAVTSVAGVRGRLARALDGSRA
jgi:DNA repair exonuclease SbcCD ATPase subunit